MSSAQPLNGMNCMAPPATSTRNRKQATDLPGARLGACLGTLQCRTDPLAQSRLPAGPPQAPCRGLRVTLQSNGGAPGHRKGEDVRTLVPANATNGEKPACCLPQALRRSGARTGSTFMPGGPGTPINQIAGVTPGSVKMVRCHAFSLTPVRSYMTCFTWVYSSREYWLMSLP